MAITVHTYKLLKHYSEKILNFGNVLSLGRLDILISKDEYKKFNIPFSKNVYVNNDFFFDFKFNSFKSLDASEFEGSEIIHDLNKPIEKDIGKYDTIIDFGTSEHVFDIVQNLKNINYLCKNGGHIIHCLPANNNCGHGFWQFSPELFFQLYNEKNCFYETELILINMLEKNKFYKVENYTYLERLDFNSDVPLYLFVKTKKRNNQNFGPIFQSDYEKQWKNITSEESKKSNLSKLFKNLKNNFKKIPFLDKFFTYRSDIKFYKKKNYLRSKFIKRVNI